MLRELGTLGKRSSAGTFLWRRRYGCRGHSAVGLLLRQYLAQFDDCFARKDTPAHLLIYIRGQWSNLQRKSVAPIALQTGLALRTFQEFLSQHRWDCQRVRELVHQIAVRETGATPERIWISDETKLGEEGRQDARRATGFDPHLRQ